MSVNGSVVGFAFSPASNESSKDRRGRDTEKVLSLVQEIYEEALNLSSYKDLAIVSDYATFLGEWMADFDGEYAAYRAAAAADPGSFEAQIAMGAKAVARSR